MSKKTKTTGILTLELRKTLAKTKISPNVLWNEFDPKKGRIANKIRELPEDFQTIIGSPHCWDFLIDYEIRNKLLLLERILADLGSWNPTPIRRIKAIQNGEKRIFEVEMVSLLNWRFEEQEYLRQHLADEETALKPEQRRARLEEIKQRYFLAKIKEKSSLKPNEWNIIFNYYKKIEKINPYHLPLDKTKQYSWQDIKTILINATIVKPKIELKFKNEFKESDAVRIQVADQEKQVKKILDSMNKKIQKDGYQYAYPLFDRVDSSKHIKLDDIPEVHRKKLTKYSSYEKDFRDKIKKIGMTAKINPLFY